MVYSAEYKTGHNSWLSSLYSSADAKTLVFFKKQGLKSLAIKTWATEIYWYVSRPLISYTVCLILRSLLILDHYCFLGSWLGIAHMSLFEICCCCNEVMATNWYQLKIPWKCSGGRLIKRWELRKGGRMAQSKVKWWSTRTFAVLLIIVNLE